MSDSLRALSVEKAVRNADFCRINGGCISCKRIKNRALKALREGKTEITL